MVSRLLLAGVFLYAGIPKLFNVDRFAEVVGAYGLLPDLLVVPASFVLAALEVFAGIGLLMRKKKALVLTTALMFVFIAVLVYGIWLGLDIDCGCFAEKDSAYGAFSSLPTALYRDMLLLVPLFYLYIQPHLKTTQGKIT